MRLKVGATLLVFVASFTLAACDEAPKSDSPADQAPVQIEFDFDDTKTKTVTVSPTLTQAPYQVPAATTKSPSKVTTTTKPRATR